MKIENSSDLHVDVKIGVDDLTINPSFGESSNYNLIANKPKINSIELESDKAAHELGLQSTMTTITNAEIDSILYGGDNNE